MSGPRITIDGLWRCLCPSVNAALLQKAVSAPYRPRLASKHPARETACASLRPTQALHTARSGFGGKETHDTLATSDVRDTRILGTPDRAIQDSDHKDLSSKTSEDGEDLAQKAAMGATSVDGMNPGRLESQIQAPTRTAHNSGKARPLPPSQTWRETMLPPRIRGTIVERILETEPPYDRFPAHMTAADAMEALRISRTKGKPKWRRLTTALVKHLLSNGPGLNTFIYETLLDTHALPEGSAMVVKNLLEEMRANKIPWSQYAYHSAIRALAVHPDYLLRNNLIREMKERWVEILPEGHRYIALGLLRDEQYELALEKLDSMVRDGVYVDPWVFDIFIYVFGKLGFLDDALRIARHQTARGFEIPVNIWYFLLDVCSEDQNYEATTYVWNRAVQPGLVNPSDGVALNILNMSAAYGDTDLATQVIQYLAARGTRLGRPHYEALADAYNTQGMVGKAIEAYCIMHDAGAEVGQQTVGSFCQVLARDPLLVDKAVQTMSELKEKYKLPIGVFNAVLNEMARCSARPHPEAFESALALYRRIADFIPAGPNLGTFQTLLRHCTKPDVAQFFVGEMLAFNVRQSLSITELLFKIHVAHHGPTHRAKDYFFKIAPHLQRNYAQGSRRLDDIMNLSLKLVKRLIKERDPEAWRILDVCKENGLDEDRVRKLREDVEAGRVDAADVADAEGDNAETRDEQEPGLSGWSSLKSTPAADS